MSANDAASVARAWLARVADGHDEPAPALPTARAFLDAHPVAVARQTAPGKTSYDTPWPVADALAAFIASRPGLPDAWGDPCVGVGRLIVSAWEALIPGRDPVALRRSVFGSDIDGVAVQAACDALCVAVAGTVRAMMRDGESERARELARAAGTDAPFVVADALDLRLSTAGDVRIVTNPPFVGARAMRRQGRGAQLDALRRRVQTCVGAFDLSIPIVDACLDACQAGGFAAVLPATWASVDYAAPMRARMGRAGQWVHLDACGARFSASVATVVVGLAASAGDRPVWSWSAAITIPGCVPLASVASVRGGLPGFDATATSDALVEAADAQADGWTFVTAARLRPYRVINAAVRTMGRVVADARLPRTAAPPRRAELYDAPKLLVPPLFRSLYASLDREGAAVGVGVTSILADTEVASVLLAVLNSPSADRVLRVAQPGTELSGGYRRVSVGALRALPVPDPTRDDVLADLGRVTILLRHAEHGGVEAVAELNDIVERWYGVGPRVANAAVST